MAATTNPKPFQFTLWHLAVATFWASVILALTVQLGGVGVILALLICCNLAAYYAQLARPETLLKVTVPLMIAATVWLTVLLPAVSTPRVQTRRSQCRNNLKTIGLALHNYHDVYGSFPPAYVGDETGRPMHSWRVLLLPFLEQKPLYDLYDFNEPWDGANNGLLAAQIVRVYSCPSDETANPVATNYVAVVGPGTAWPDERPVKLSQITDGTSNTILIVEVHNSGIHWMEPRDLDAMQTPVAINPQRGQGISSLHPKGAQVLFADGSVHFLPDNLDPQTLQGLLTIAGGENVRPP